ncbi:hypothetical protein GOV09_00565 [Candidatus Woesearchaeota archaeon]|nr:hypothetical protein [Candidatus Woesearchaeota archaeon]
MEDKIKVTGDYSRINDEEKKFFNRRIDKFIEKHDNDFSEMLINLDCHTHKETSRGRPSYHCKLTVHTDQGKFHADSHDFGGEKSLSGALAKVEKQMQKKR